MCALQVVQRFVPGIAAVLLATVLILPSPVPAQESTPAPAPTDEPKNDESAEEKSDKTEATDKTDKTEATDKADKTEATDKAEKSGSGDPAEESAETEEAKEETQEGDGSKEAEGEDPKAEKETEKDTEKETEKEKPANKPAKKQSLLDILKLRKGTQQAKKDAAEAKVGKTTQPKPAAVPAPPAAAVPAPPAAAVNVQGQDSEVVVATEETSDDGEDEGDGEDAAAEEPKEPVPPMFWMRDGTRLAGFPRLRQMHVQTAYGSLVIPVSEITRVRFASVQKKEFVEKVRGLVKQLGHEEFDLREEAMEELRQLGVASLDVLKEAQQAGEDEEIRSRLEKLVGEFEEDEEEPEEDEIHTVPIKGDEDEVVTMQFTVKGRVIEESFEVTTRYAQLTFHRDDIISIVFQEPLVSKRTVQVPGTAIAATASKWIDTKVELEKGESYEIAATGTMQLQRYNVPCGPEGTSNAPTRFEKFPAGALVGRIGAKGKAFLVGASFKGEAPEKGNLFLAVALRTSNPTGSYEVEIETEEKEEAKAKKKSTAKAAEKEAAARAAAGAVRVPILRAVRKAN